MKMDYKSRLASLLSVERTGLIRLVAAEAARYELPLYMVGGTVRDLLLGRAVNDFDLVVEGDAIKLARALASGHGGRVTAHAKFGTAKWFLPGNLKRGAEPDDTLDLISARSETYNRPAALPTVRPGNIEEDIRRRDFTINALALRLDGSHFGEVRNDLNSLDDLRDGMVRALHPRSFLDDPTRMYRAVRYEKRYQFRIADETLALIPEARSLVASLSAQRIRHELDLILGEPAAVSMLARLDELDLLASIHPLLSNFSASHLARQRPDKPALQSRQSRWILWLLHLTEQDVGLLHARLRFTTGLLKLLRSASGLHARRMAVVGLKPAQTVEFLEGHAIEAIEVLSAVAEEEDVRTVLRQYLSEWRHVKPKTTGHDLKRRGVAQGPQYAEILRRLRAAWLDGEVNDADEESKLLATLLR